MVYIERYLFNKFERNIIFDIKKKLLKTLARFMPHSKIRIALFRLSGYSIGKDVFIGEDLIISDGMHDRNVFIEERASIGPRVTLITYSGPNSSRIRPYVKVVKGEIRIEKDAWIGAGVIILPNLIIGEGAIVGAGAVVTKNVPPYSIVTGVPAKVIKYVNMDHKA